MGKCCIYQGTDDCAPCQQPPWLWNMNRKLRATKSRNPQKRWISAMIKVWSENADPD